MASRKRCVATCSTCKARLQEIIETGETDDLYLMSISLLPGVVKIGAVQMPDTARAPFLGFPKSSGSIAARTRNACMQPYAVIV